jgi:signal transduction histidine kinase
MDKQGEIEQDNFWRLTLDQVMDRNPCCVVPDTPVGDVIALIHAGVPQHRGYALVVTAISSESYGQLLGLFSEREVLSLVAQGVNWEDCPVSAVMRTDPPHLRASDYDTILTPLQLMQTHRIPYLPVLNQTDQVIGILKPNLNQWVWKLLQQVKPDTAELESWSQQCLLPAESSLALPTDQADLKSDDKASFLEDLKDAFLSIISHELRTPITSIQLALHMIKKTSSAEKREKYYQIAVENCNLQRDLINDLLDLQRLEASAYHLHLKTEGIREWLETFLERHTLQFQIPQDIIRLTMSPQVSPLRTDYTALDRILRELIHNAYKYGTPDGLIEFSVTTQEQGILFSVRNSSTIHPQDLPYIFDQFYRAHHSDPWKYKGMGLGLALAKQLVELLQGHISVVSQANITTFTVWIPNFRDVI